MNAAMQQAEAQPAPRAVASAAEAELLIQHLHDVMEALLETVEEETRLVRAGKLRDATALEPTKAELSHLYTVDTIRIKASQPYVAKVATQALSALRERHNMFQAVLQMNLTVLATAHAVSEGIMRGAANELARKAQPAGYGATGHAVTPPKGVAQPLTVSRSL
jgi:hypothetical protein